MYTVTVLTDDREVLHEAFEMFGFLGPAKSYARSLAACPEYVAAGATRIEVVNEASVVVFDIGIDRQSV